MSLERAVLAICPDIETRVRRRPRDMWGESDLRLELARCVLSSQVPYALADAAATRLLERSLLEPRQRDYERLLERALTEPICLNGRARRYRFPRTRAEQLATTFRRIAARADGLRGLLESKEEPEVRRSCVMHQVSGFGPKQASMFLRNIGASFELAILDRHLLRYSNALRVTAHPLDAVLTYRKYLELERSLRSYAATIGWPIGYLDWAVWIVMTAARSESMS